MDFVQKHKITPEGEALVEYLDGVCAAFEESGAGGLSGHVAHYYTMAYKADGKSARLPKQKGGGVGVGTVPWLEQFPTLAERAHYDMVSLQEQNDNAQHAAETVNVVEAQLAALQEQVAEVVKELKAEKKKTAKLVKQLKEAEAETEPESEDAEPEDEPEPDEDDAEAETEDADESEG